jgi:hypothetical protein
MLKIKVKIYTLILIIFTINCNSQTTNVEILKPEINKNCLRGQCVNNQWYDNIYSKNYYIVVIKDDAELKSKPQNDSIVLRKMSRFTQVTALYLKPDVEIINNQKHRWVFVGENSPDGNLSNYGWIVDSDLGFKNKFEKFVNPDIKRINFFYGDVEYKIALHVDGSFSGNWVNTYPSAKIKNGLINGLIYKCYNYISLIDSQTNRPPIFIDLKDEFVKVEK